MNTITDKPLHLAELGICKRERYTEPSVTVSIWVTQGSLDAIQSLIQTLTGMAHAGTNVQGLFDLTMFYRTLCRNILDAETRHNMENTEDK